MRNNYNVIQFLSSYTHNEWDGLSRFHAVRLKKLYDLPMEDSSGAGEDLSEAELFSLLESMGCVAGSFDKGSTATMPVQRRSGTTSLLCGVIAYEACKLACDGVVDGHIMRAVMLDIICLANSYGSARAMHDTVLGVLKGAGRWLARDEMVTLEESSDSIILRPFLRNPVRISFLSGASCKPCTIRGRNTALLVVDGAETIPDMHSLVETTKPVLARLAPLLPDGVSLSRVIVTGQCEGVVAALYARAQAGVKGLSAIREPRVDQIGQLSTKLSKALNFRAG
jgi:hypothetical protein